MNIEVILDRIYSGKRLRLLLHLSFWLIMLLFKWYLSTISFNVYRGLPPQTLFLINLFSVLCFAFFYYTLVYYIIPKYFNKGKYLAGSITVVLLVIIYTFLDSYFEIRTFLSCSPCQALMKEHNNDYYYFLQLDFSNLLLKKISSMGIFIGLLFNISLPLGIRFAIGVLRQNILTLKIAKENVQLEFNFLKSQINPHFLFNSLNNIYGLVLNNDVKKSGDLIARLSEFMRYTLYETNEAMMPLQKEIQLVNDYIALERVRLNFIDITIDDQQPNGTDILVPPLLFMPIVENAFKFTPDKSGSFIAIHLVLKENELYFKCENTIDLSFSNNKEGGIGLQNLKKRLDLYYPQRHKYNFKQTNISYVATLKLKV